MNREMLSHVLAQFDIRPYTYNLDWRGDSVYDWELYGMTLESDGWHVFYAERGQRNAERVYINEADACDAMLMYVAKSFSGDRDWRARLYPGRP